MSELSDGDESALDLGDLLALAVVCLDKVGDGQEVRDDASLDLGKSLHLLSQSNAGPLEESSQKSVVLPAADLAEELSLVGCLVAEDVNVHIGGVTAGIECICLEMIESVLARFDWLESFD